MAYKPIEQIDEIQQIKKEIVKSPKEIYKVVLELPTQKLRKIREEDGTIVNLITIEEYLTAQANAGA
jgi:uncharacterized membrane protein (UPF0127 family)